MIEFIRLGDGAGEKARRAPASARAIHAAIPPPPDPDPDPEPFPLSVSP